MVDGVVVTPIEVVSPHGPHNADVTASCLITNLEGLNWKYMVLFPIISFSVIRKYLRRQNICDDKDQLIMVEN
jgi:hypothetical protein